MLYIAAPETFSETFANGILLGTLGSVRESIMKGRVRGDPRYEE